MSFFNKMFSSNEQEENLAKVNWIPLDDLKVIDEAVALSYEKPVVLFKHSTRCSISRFALKQFENEYDLSKEQMEPFFLDLLNHRNISDEIAKRFNIEHQSPQMIVLKDGVAIFSSTHSDIEAGILKKFVQ
jgi:bacillithiol system protein YtxJ